MSALGSPEDGVSGGAGAGPPRRGEPRSGLGRPGFLAPRCARSTDSSDADASQSGARTGEAARAPPSLRPWGRGPHAVGHALRRWGAVHLSMRMLGRAGVWGILSTVTVSRVRGCGLAHPPCTGSGVASPDSGRAGRARGRAGDAGSPPSGRAGRAQGQGGEHPTCEMMGGRMPRGEAARVPSPLAVCLHPPFPPPRSPRSPAAAFSSSGCAGKAALGKNTHGGVTV